MKINILLITTVSNIGGTESMLLSFLSNFDSENFNVVIASLFGKDELGKEVVKRGVQFTDLNFKNVLTYPFKLRKIIKQNNIDLVQTFGLTAEVAVNPLAKIFGAKKIVASIRSAYTDRKWYHHFLSGIVNRNVDLWISNSQAGKNTTIKNLKIESNKIKVSRNGLDTSKFADEYIEQSDQLKTELNLTDKFVILTVANLRSEKRHSDIIKAVKLIDKHIRENLKFIFIGRDDLNGNIEREIRDSNLSNYFMLSGFRSDVAAYYELADLFLLTSDWEGLPVSIMEAMYFSKPIISTNVGGVNELVNHEKEGLLIEPRNPEQIADKIIQLYNNKNLRAKLGRNAHERIVKEFSLKKMVNETEQTYIDLMEGKYYYAKDQNPDTI
ncbi:MAG: glycosyltransferase [Ignavibacterium sp.]|nr:MAG: glycosyltransferase [Ignavibacterium sp.]